jgi:hypothetical protein
VADQKIKDMVIAAAIEAEATPASPLFEFRSHGLQLLLRWSTISNEAAFGTAYFILMAMAKSPLAARAAFTDGSWTPRRRCSAPSEGVATSMSANGATLTCHNVRYPVAMGWPADLAEAVLNKLALRVPR